MTDGRDEDVFFFAWDTECLERGVGIPKVGLGHGKAPLEEDARMEFVLSLGPFETRRKKMLSKSHTTMKSVGN
jgi:hypothetical protein